MHLEGGKPDCRIKDCNLGNLVTDALVKMTQKLPDEKSWATVTLAIWNGGGLRASINKKKNGMNYFLLTHCVLYYSETFKNILPRYRNIS